MQRCKVFFRGARKLLIQVRTIFYCFRSNISWYRFQPGFSQVSARPKLKWSKFKFEILWRTYSHIPVILFHLSRLIFYTVAKDFKKLVTYRLIRSCRQLSLSNFDFSPAYYTTQEVCFSNLTSLNKGDDDDDDDDEDDDDDDDDDDDVYITLDLVDEFFKISSISFVSCKSRIASVKDFFISFSISWI